MFKLISDKIDLLKNFLKVEERGKYLILVYMSLKNGKMDVDNVDKKLFEFLRKNYVCEFVEDDLDKYVESMEGYYFIRNGDRCYEFDLNIMKKIVFVSLVKDCILFVKMNYENECLKYIIFKDLCFDDMDIIYVECFIII